MKTTSLLPWRVKTIDDKNLVELQQAMNELLGGFVQPSDWSVAPWSGNARNWSPRVDVAETDKEIIVTAELPGLQEKDVDVSLSGDQLVISGEKREEKEESSKTLHRIERSWGSFQRVLPLYWDVDRSSVKALFAKGVLTVTLTKSAKAQELVRKIPVKAG